MKNIRSFLLTLTLTTIATTSLGAMESQCMDVETIAPEHEASALLHVYAALSNELPQELVHYILSLHLISHLQDLQASHHDPKALVIVINEIQKKCGSFLAVEILKKSLVHAGISLCDIKDNYGCTALHDAAHDGQTEVVKVLLAAAEDKAWELICMKDKYGCTALHSAAYYDQTEVVKVLLAAAKDKAWKLICMKDGHYGNTALHCAAHYEHTEVVKVLLAAAKDKTWELICIKSNNGSTAFHSAAYEVVKVLLAAADGRAWEIICMKNNIGCTTLHWAAYSGHVNIVDILLAAAGGKAWELICIKNNNNRTALDLANNKIKQIMEQYRPNNQ